MLVTTGGEPAPNFVVATSKRACRRAAPKKESDVASDIDMLSASCLKTDFVPTVVAYSAATRKRNAAFWSGAGSTVPKCERQATKLHSQSIDRLELSRQATHVADHLYVAPTQTVLLGGAFVSAANRGGPCSGDDTRDAYLQPKNTLQTTRLYSGTATANWSGQAAACAVLTSVVSDMTGAGDGRCPIAWTPTKLVQEKRDGVPAFVAYTRSGLESVINQSPFPRNLVDSVRRLAVDEMECSAVTARSPETECDTRQLCSDIVHRTDGLTKWRVLVLLDFLSFTAPGRDLLRERKFTSHDVAVARELSKFALTEVSRRGGTARGKKRRQQEAADKEGEEQEGEQEGEEDGEREGEQEVEEDDGVEWEEEDDGLVELRASARADNPALLMTAEDMPPPPGVEEEDDVSVAGQLESLNVEERSPSSSSLAETVSACVVSSPHEKATRRKRTFARKPSLSKAAVYLRTAMAALDSESAHVLHLTLSSSSSAQLGSVTSYLTTQLQGAAGDDCLSTLAINNARRSNDVISKSFLQTGQCEVPAALFHGDGSVAIVRSSKELSDTALLAGRTAPRAATPCAATILWGDALARCQTPTVSDADTTGDSEWVVRTPLFAQHLSDLVENEDSASKRLLARLERQLHSDAVLTSGYVSGTTRAVVARSIRLAISKTLLKTSRNVSKGIVAEAELIRARNAYALQERGVAVAKVLNAHAEVSAALPTPANVLALLFHVNSTLVNLQRERSTNDGKVGRVALLFLGPLREKQEVSGHHFSEFDAPQPYIQVVDTSLSFQENAVAEAERAEGEAELVSRPDAAIVRADVAFCVAGAEPARVLEAAKSLARAASSSEPTARQRAYSHARALLLAGAAQASYVNEAASCRIPEMWVSTQSAKRVHVIDHVYLNLTVLEAFRIGHRNVAPRASETPWHGAYGAGLDFGITGSLGRGCNKATGDLRMPCKFWASDHVLEELTAEFRSRTLVGLDDGTMAWRPLETRGVPLACWPGMHAYLDTLQAALKRTRDHLGCQERTVDSVQVFPVGPFSERPTPRVLDGGDDAARRLSFRNPSDAADGYSFVADSTLRELSVTAGVLEPPTTRNGTENVLNPLSQQLGVFLNMAALVGALSMSLPGREEMTIVQALDELKNDLLRWHTTEEDALPDVPGTFMLAADVSVLLNVLFPLNVDIDGDMIMNAHAIACNMCMMSEQPLRMLVQRELLEEATAYVLRVLRPEVWGPFCDLVVGVHLLDGRLDPTKSELSAVRESLRAAVQSIWFVHSEDGVSPPTTGPLSTCQSSKMVNESVVRSVYVDKLGDDGVWSNARGALVGSTECGLRSVLALMMACGEDWAPDVKVWRNEGGLCERPSCSSLILENGGATRSSKATSPLGLEGDAAAYGTHEARVRSHARQTRAADKNLMQMKELFLRLSKPGGVQERMEATTEAVSYHKRKSGLQESASILGVDANRVRHAHRECFMHLHF